MRLVLATANPDKAAEIAGLLDGFELMPRPGDMLDVEETGATLEDNALIKARAVMGHTGLSAVADDTGLEVHALGGAPGVRSARFAGPRASYADNVSALLSALAEVPPERRRARFRTVAAASLVDGRELLADGVVEGTITGSPRGTNGFGYDPVFVPDGGQLTFAEMPLVDKQAVSHRARAFRALAEALRVQCRS